MFGSPGDEVPWGDDTRTIMKIAESASEGGILFEFLVKPAPGDHLGHGVFLADPDALGDGITYNSRSVAVHVFQAAAGDTNGDRHVDNADLQLILASGLFGAGLYAAEGAAAVVPEPGTLAMLACGLVILLWWRRRRAT